MSPRTRAQNEQVRDDRRFQILFSALHLFARGGVQATRMADVAAAAGMSHGLAYHYFSSKEDIFHELVELAFKTSLDAYQAAAGAPGTPWDRLSLLVSSIIPAAYDGVGTDFFLLMIQAFTLDWVPERTRALIARRRTEYGQILEPLIAEGQAAGEVREGDPGALATAITAMIQGLAIMKTLQETAPLPSADVILGMLRKE